MSKRVAEAASGEPMEAGPACNAWTPDLAKTPAYMAETTYLLLIVALVVVQGLMHFPEHVVQVVQLEVTHTHPHGILGVFNLEWVHFIYNLGVLAIMVPVVVSCGFFARGNAWKRANPAAWYALMVSFWLKAVIHMPEHYAKVSQHLMTGQESTPGLIGYYVGQVAGTPGLIWMHFWLNLIVLAPLVYILFAYDVLGALSTRLFPARGSTA